MEGISESGELEQVDGENGHTISARGTSRYPSQTPCHKALQLIAELLALSQSLVQSLNTTIALHSHRDVSHSKS